MKLSTAYDIYHSLLLLTDQYKNLSFPAPVANAIIYNMRVLQRVYENGEKDRKILFNKYPLSPVDDGAYEVPLEERENLNSELEKLANREEHIFLKKIKLSDIQNLNLSIPELSCIYDIIEEDC